MPTNRLARPLRRCDFGQHLGVARGHTRKVHHLTQTDDTGPCHRFGHVISGDFESGRF